MPKLIGHRYGKGRVRVMKILRDGETHRLKDVDVKAMMRGDFEASYTAGDNRKVVPTDTIKNTISVFAKDHLQDEIEQLGMHLARHFVTEYPQIHTAEIDILERSWDRMIIGGAPHAHSFFGNDASRGYTHVTCDRGQEPIVESGVRDLIILKSTRSGFEDYPKDAFTTLKETSDRILGTSFSANWRFQGAPANFSAANSAILAAMMKVFAENYSPSAQTTLFQMGEAALAACPEVSRLDLAMPNKHCLLIDLSPFGRENKNEVFLPIDEPHGQIEATIER